MFTTKCTESSVATTPCVFRPITQIEDLGHWGGPPTLGWVACSWVRCRAPPVWCSRCAHLGLMTIHAFVFSVNNLPLFPRRKNPFSVNKAVAL